jgi:hypothetical protein
MEARVRRIGNVPIQAHNNFEAGPALRKSPTLSGVYELPPMKMLRGISCSPDKVLELANCSIQYQSEGGDAVFDLNLPLTEAVKLLSYLMHMIKNERVQPHLKLIADREIVSRRNPSHHSDESQTT